MKKLKNIVFDLDGTLIDSSKSILLCLEESLKSLRIESKVKLTSSLIGPPLKELIEKITSLENSKIKDRIIIKFKELYDNKFYKEIESFLTDDQIESLNLKYNIFIATNKRFIPAVKIIDHLRWTPYIKDIYALDMPSGEKISNKSDLLSYLIKRESLGVKETVYIGDRYEDMESSFHNSIRFAYAKWGYEKFHPGQDVIILDNTRDLLSIENIINNENTPRTI